YTDDFRAIQQLEYNAVEALSVIEFSNKNTTNYVLYPPLLDNAFQTLLSIVACNDSEKFSDVVFLPTDIAQITVFSGIAHDESQYSCHAVITGSSNHDLQGNVDIYHIDGSMVASVQGLRCVGVKKEIWDSLIMGSSDQDQLDDLFQVSWIPAPANPEPVGSNVQSSWLIIADSLGHANSLNDYFVDAGDDVSVFPVTFLETEGAEAELKSIATKGNFSGVVYMSSLDITPQNVYADPTIGCARLLQLVQSLNNLSLCVPLWIITKGTQQITPGSVHPEQAALWGFAQVISLENPNILCCCVDLDPRTPDSSQGLLKLLKSETSETKIAIRSDTMYVSRLMPYTLSRDTIDLNFDEANNAVKCDATYIITGAFGALGRLLTSRLIERGAGNLVLLSRSGSLGNEDYISELGASGANILAACADVSKLSDIKKILHEITNKMPPIKGVIHAAGILDDQVIAHQSRASFERTMRPKVQGAWNLHEATLDCALDFFVCFSSVASLIGSPGQSNYAAANAFMDAFSGYRKALGLPAISINWGPWSGEGMASSELDRLAAKGFEPLDENRGLQLFELLLRGEHPPQVGVSPINWENFFEEFPAFNVNFLSHFSSGNRSINGADKKFRPELDKAEDAKKEELLLNHISSIVNSVFGFDPSKEDNREISLFDNGLDSLMAIEIKTKLERSLEMTFPATLLFDHSTVDKLGSFLMQELGFTKLESDGIDTDALLKELDQLTEAELAEMLEAELI
ncbi:MAG: acyl carrier protein, partial [Candidatus Azotimanducaceae bacterium]